MKKIILIFLLMCVSSACDNGFEELNVDPTKPTQINVGNKLSATQLFTSGGRFETWRANLIYQAAMMQHLSTTAGFWAGDKYTWNKGYASSLFDRYYPSAVKSIEDILFQLDEEGAPDEMKAIARIMRVFIYSRLTDLYGDIPYSEAGQAVISGILKPKYDKQSEIYPDLLKELEESANALGSGISEFGDADLIYKGDQAKWKRLANSLMLRLGFRLIKVDPDASKEWVTKAIAGGVMQSNADIFYIEHTVGPEGINRNGNGEVFTVDDSPSFSETFINFLQDDPRLPILAERRSDGSNNPDDLIGLPNGLDSQLLLDQLSKENTDTFARPNRSTITGEDAPMFFQTYAEVEFLLAEANVRWGLAGNAEDHYNNGVRAAMKMLELYGPNAAISDAQVDAYLQLKPYDPSNALEQINTQYWAATFFNDYETFANWRRTGYPTLNPVNFPGNVTNGTIPRRMSYSENEQTDNAENYQAAVSNQGPDELSTRVWWDVP